MAEFGPLAGDIGSTDDADIEGRDIRFVGSDVGSEGSGEGYMSADDIDDNYHTTQDIVEVIYENEPDDLEAAFQQQLAVLNDNLQALSSRRKREQQRDTPSQAQLRDYQKRIHDTTLEILNVKREMKRAQLEGGRAPPQRALVRRTPFSTHRTPETRRDDDNVTYRMRLELKEANKGLTDLERSDLEALRKQAQRLTVVRATAADTALGSADELAAVRDVRKQAEALVREANRTTADVALASTAAQVQRTAEQSGDSALARDAGRMAGRATSNAQRDVEFEKRTAINLVSDLNRLENDAKHGAANSTKIVADLTAESAVVEQRALDEPRAVTRIKRAEQATERLNTNIAVVIPANARFTLPSDSIVGDFGTVFTNVFAPASKTEFVLESRPTKSDPNFVFMIRRASRATALLLVTTLFRDILGRWARTANIGAQEDGYVTLRTRVWADTLVPLLTAIVLATKTAHRKDNGNAPILEFMKGLEDSVGWLFTLVLTGVTYYDTSNAIRLAEERSEGQRNQTRHPRRQSRFETLGVNFGAFEEQLPDVQFTTYNQLLSGDVDYAGKGISHGISTPMLKMAFSLSQPRANRKAPPAVFNNDFRSIINRINSRGERTVDFDALNDPKKDAITEENKWAAPTTSSIASELSRVFMLPVFEALVGEEMRALTGSTSSYETVDYSFDKKWLDNLGILPNITVGDCPPYIYDITDVPPPPRQTIEWSVTNHTEEEYDNTREFNLTDADIAAVQTMFIKCVNAAATVSTAGRKTFQAATKLHFLAALAKQLASTYQFLTDRNKASLQTRLDMMTAIVGATMFTPFKLAPDKDANVESFFARFGKRPSVEVKTSEGTIVRRYVETAHKASGSTKRSDFRPGFLPQALGGKSNKTLGTLIRDSKDLSTSAFRRFMGDDERIQQKLDDTQDGKRYTVLVPSTEAYGEPDALAVARDPGAIYKAFEFHTFDEELDLEKLGKEPLKRHTVYTELAGLTLRFSVNRGFSNTKGGTIKLFNATLLGGGHTLGVVSGVSRAKNGHFYVVDGIIDTEHSEQKTNTATTKESEFRPSWLPKFVGGKSKKTLDVLIEESNSPTTSTFRDLLAENASVKEKLSETGRQMTVLVPSTRALGESSASTLTTEGGARLLHTVDFHIFDAEIDLEQLSKNSMKRHLAATAYDGKKVRFSVDRGFSNSKGGTLTLWDGLTTLDGSHTVRVISGATRAKNGVFYVVDGVLDVKKADAIPHSGAETTTVESEFRPSWLPEYLGGKSRKTVGEMIANDDSLTTSGCRRLLDDDYALNGKLEEGDLGYKFTVLVPSTEALSTSEGLALAQDDDELRNTLEFHILNEELDLEKLGRDPLQRHSVFTEFAGVPLKFTVNRGFSNTKGGTIKLLNASVLGGGRTVNVISGARRGSNGVWYVIDDVLDGMEAGYNYQKLVANKKKRAKELAEGTSTVGLKDAIAGTTTTRIPPPLATVGAPPVGSVPLPPPFVSTREKAKYISNRIAKIKEHGAAQASTATPSAPTTSVTTSAKGGAHLSNKHRLLKMNANRSRSRHMLRSMARGGTYLDSFDRHVDSLRADETGAENKDDPTQESISDHERLIEWLRGKKEESRKTIPSSNKERNARGQYTNAKKKSVVVLRRDDDRVESEQDVSDDDNDEAIVFKRSNLDDVDEEQGPGLFLQLAQQYNVLDDLRRDLAAAIIFAPEPSLLSALDLSALSNDQIATLLREHIVTPIWSSSRTSQHHQPTHRTITPRQLKDILSGELTSHSQSLETLNGVGTSKVVLLPRTAHGASFDKRSSVITLKDIEPNQNTLIYEDGKEREHPVYIYMIKKILTPTDLSGDAENAAQVESQTKRGHHSMKTLTAAKAAKISQGVLLAPENESRAAKETRAQQWLADLEGTTNMVKKERDAQKLIEHIDRLSKHLDRIGGADGIKKDLSRADIDRVFDNLDRAIAQNRNIDPIDKDEARQQMLDLQARFDLL